MKYILLCGGSGKRLSPLSFFPKPMNYILGTPSVKYVVDNIPSDEIFVIVNKDLAEFNFETSLYHLCKEKKFHFIYLDRYTRGPVETAYLGIKSMLFSLDEQVCFFDNDTVYELDNISLPQGNFLCYSTLPADAQKKPYCFLEINDKSLVTISEKVQISQDYACGVYGFESGTTFLQIAKELLTSNITYNNEFYMSLLYDSLIKQKKQVSCVNVPVGCCVGTPDDILGGFTKLKKHTKRICFDIDNTLLTLRAPHESYADIKPIPKILFLLKELKKAGHEIILYTARGMRTHRSNAGKALKAVAMDTFDVLEKYEIPYDEIYFGKPDADIYIDDKAFNPYSQTLFDQLGFTHLNDLYANKPSSSSTNKFNSVVKKGTHILKEGPLGSMNGELFFYKTITNTSISNYFPKYYGKDLKAESMVLDLEFIDGFLLFDLLKDQLLSESHLDIILESLVTIHSYPGIAVDISKEAIYDNYMGKLWKRSEKKADYPFENTKAVLEKMDVYVKKYIYSEAFQPVSVVHGDCWFSNTLLSKENRIYFLDMKGAIGDTLTTNGDPLTDFGKILQSLLGFDFIVNSIEHYDKEYLQDLETIFFSKIENLGFDRPTIYAITACLVAKTISFLNVSEDIRSQIWEIVVNLVNRLQ
jgi:capsule biosynthesis phosphatase